MHSQSHQAWARVAPSLALIKYWGKQDRVRNIPATSSLAVSLEGLYTHTVVEESAGADQVFVDEREMPGERFADFFRQFREASGYQGAFLVRSRNSFPTAAGLASSSSGFAALAMACNRLLDAPLEQKTLSALARQGSASAARALYSGFVSLPAGATAAEVLYPPSFWPELRIIVLAVSRVEKPIASREAMERARKSSPYYQNWLEDSRTVYQEALKALAARDLERLGPLVQQSYLRMFSTMFSSRPPVIYWQPESLRIIDACRQWREEGLQVWETMDAGPQVKLLCLEAELEAVLEGIGERFPDLDLSWTCRVGGACESGSGPGNRAESLL